jgi:hypothetical protein
VWVWGRRTVWRRGKNTADTNTTAYRRLI